MESEATGEPPPSEQQTPPPQDKSGLKRARSAMDPLDVSEQSSIPSKTVPFAAADTVMGSYKDKLMHDQTHFGDDNSMEEALTRPDEEYESDNDSDEIVTSHAPPPAINGVKNVDSSHVNDRATLKAGLQTSAKIANKSSSKKPTKSTTPSTSSPATSNPKIATTEPTRIDLTSTPTSTSRPRTSVPPLPPNQHQANSTTLISPMETIDFVPESPLTTPQPTIQISHDSDEIGIGINGAAREKDVIMNENISSHNEELSDETIVECTDSVMQG